MALVRRMVAGLLQRSGRVLLCHRRADRDFYPGVWDLPGGHVQAGESIMDALARELREELGIVPQLAQDAPFWTFEADGLHLFVYLIHHWQGEARNAAPDEHDKIAWVSFEELSGLDLADPSYSEMLARALDP